MTQHAGLESEESFLASFVPTEDGDASAKKPRRSVMPSRPEGIKPRISMQQSSKKPVSASDSSTRSFFENLINGDGSVRFRNADDA